MASRHVLFMANAFAVNDSECAGECEGWRGEEPRVSAPSPVTWWTPELSCFLLLIQLLG